MLKRDVKKDEDANERVSQIVLPSDKRQHARIAVNEEFQSIEEYIAEYVVNISHGGVYIRSKQPLPIGTKVTLNFSVILEDIESIEGEGEVVRVDMSQKNVGMGIAFTRLSAESSALIERIYSHYLE